MGVIVSSPPFGGVITKTSTTAFVTEDASGTDVIVVDTTNLRNTLNKTTITPNANTTTTFLVENAAGTDVFQVDTTNRRLGLNVAPSAVAQFRSTGTDYDTKVFRIEDSAGTPIHAQTSDGRSYFGSKGDDGGNYHLQVGIAASDVSGKVAFTVIDASAGSSFLEYRGVAAMPTVGGVSMGITSTNGIHFGNSSTWTEEFIKTSAGVFHIQPGRAWGAGGDILIMNPSTFTSGKFVAYKVNSVEAFSVNYDGLTTITVPAVETKALEIKSIATNDDPNYKVYQGRVATTDATVTTINTVAITASNTYLLEARVVARRTGGTAGTADDGAVYIRRAMITTKAGTVTINATQDGLTQEDQAGWDCTLAVSGANVLVRVTGAVDNSITWHSTLTVQNVGT